MKRTIYVITVLIAGAMITMFSCTKENKIADNVTAKSNLSPHDIKINKLINDFKTTMAYHKANPNLKDDELIPADSALWYLEATINYSHAFPNEYYKQFEVDTSYIAVPVNGDGTVDMAILTQKYEDMKTTVAADYHISAFTEKGLSFVDLSQISNNGSELTIMVKAATGEKGEDPGPGPTPDGPFEESDNWWYGEEYGYCYDHSVFDDAANQLYQETKDLVPDPTGNYYFINEFGFSIEGGDPDFRRPNDDLDNYLDYYLYYSIEGDPQIPFYEQDMLCLESYEMNIYYVFMEDLMFDILPNQYLPDKFGIYGYDIVSLNELVDYSAPEQSYYYYFHYADFTFGYKIFYSEGDGPEEL